MPQHRRQDRHRAGESRQLDGRQGDDEPVHEGIQIRGRVHDKKDAEKSIAKAVVTLKETGATYTTDFGRRG